MWALVTGVTERLWEMTDLVNDRCFRGATERGLRLSQNKKARPKPGFPVPLISQQNTQAA